MVMDHMLKGGTRSTGRPAEREAGMPVVSIITVVFNSVTLLERTIQSILGQTYPNIEYLIIDGGSKDGTVDIIRKYEDRIDFWISGPDKGLYDAMNKGLTAATGDFVWFLNSGDLVYETDTLEKVFKDFETVRLLDQETGRIGDQETKRLGDLETRSVPGTGVSAVGGLPSAVIYYGDTMVVDSNYHEIGLRRLRPPEQLTWKSFRKGMLVCHQAILVHRSIAEPYNLRYRYSADFDWVLNALKRARGHRGTRGCEEYGDGVVCVSGWGAVEEDHRGKPDRAVRYYAEELWIDSHGAEACADCGEIRFLSELEQAVLGQKAEGRRQKSGRRNRQ